MVIRILVVRKVIVIIVGRIIEVIIHNFCTSFIRALAAIDQVRLRALGLPTLRRTADSNKFDSQF